MTRENKIITRLKKLLARAKDQTDTPEGELAASIAAKLMQEHAIEISQVENFEETEEIMHLPWDIKVSNVWWSSLYHSVGKYMDVSVAYAAFRGGRHITFVGYQHNIEITKFLFDSIKNQLDTEWKTHAKERKDYCKQNDLVWAWNKPSRKNFYATAVNRVGRRLVDMKRAQSHESTTIAITNESVRKANALVFQRKNNVATFVSKLGWGTGARYSYGHSSAGASAGNNVKIQSGINGSRRLKG